MLSMLNRDRNILTKTIYKPFVRSNFNYGFSHGGTRNTDNPYWINNFGKGLNLKKRVLEQQQLITFRQTRRWNNWTNEGNQSKLVSSELNWWLMLGIISGAIGLWSFTETKTEEKEDEEHVKLNRKSYEEIVKRLKNNDPKLLSIEVQIRLNVKELKDLYDAIKDNIAIGYIAWHKDQVKCENVGLISKKLKENNKNYRYYPTDYVHALLSTHAYRNSKEKEEVTLEDKDVNEYLKGWRVEKVYDDTGTTGYYGVIYINDSTHQVVLASRGTEEITLKKLIDALPKQDSDWKTNLEEILGGKVVPGQQAWNYFATEEAVNLVKKKGYHLSFTGHSLGAWLAELGAFYCHAYLEHMDVKAVTFDSPGSYQMMKKLNSHVKSQHTIVNTDNIDIVTYLSAPNPVNICNEHVGKVYRVNREMEKTQWIRDEIVPTFIRNIFGNSISGILSVEGHMLGGLVATFDPKIGKPKENDCKRMDDWPRLEYKGERKNFKDIVPAYILPHERKIVTEIVYCLIDDTTAMSFVNLFDSLFKGKAYLDEYWEYFNHIELQNVEGKSEPKKELNFIDKFSLVGKAHYRIDKNDKNVIEMNVGSIDKLLYELSKAKLNEKDLREIEKGLLRKQLQELASSFIIEAIDSQGKKYTITSVEGKRLNIDVIKQRIIRLTKVIPGGIRELENFLGEFGQKTVLESKNENEVKIANIRLEGVPHRIPFEDSKFVGREKELKRIKEEFKNHDIIVICGVPGIGKTSLVKKYANSLKKEGELVRWIEAEASKISDEYAKLAKHFDINGLTVEEARDSIYGILNMAQRPIYLVLDNVDNEETLKRFLENKPNNVKILITTRDNRLDGHSLIELSGLMQEEAVAYILESLKISNKEARDLAQGIKSDKDKGMRPISLDLAVKYLKQRSDKTVKEYLEERKGCEGSATNPDIAVVIKSLGNNAKKVLKYCAYLDADHIPIELLKSVIDGDKLGSGIDELRRAGLMSVKVQGKSLSLHRDVQDTAKSKENEDEGFIKELLYKINGLFPDCEGYRKSNIEKAEKLVRSAVSIAEASEVIGAYKEDKEKVRTLWVKLGSYYKNVVMDLSNALSYYEKALTIDEKFPEKNHFYIVQSYNNIGSVLDSQGKYEEALICYSKALDIAQKALGEDHAEMVQSYNNLGKVLNNQGMYDEALKYHSKALTIAKKVLGKDHAQVAQSYNNLGKVLNNQGKYDEALKYYFKALDIAQKVFGEDHPQVAQSYNDIGNLLNVIQGKYDEALKYYFKALAIREKVLGKNHPRVADSYNNIAVALDYQGKYEQALEYYFKALAIAEKVLGKDHPDVAQSYHNIGVVLNNQGKYAEALEYYFKALTIAEKVLGKDHPEVAHYRNNAGVALNNQHEYDKALQYHFEALTTAKKVFGEDHAEVAQSWSNLGKVLNNQVEYDKALEYHFKALAIREKVHGENHAEVAQSYNNIGIVLNNQGKYAEALEYHSKALTIAEKVLGENHPEVAQSYNNIGVVLNNQGKYAEALEYHSKALAIAEKALGKDHPHTKSFISNVKRLEQDMSNCKPCIII